MEKTLLLFFKDPKKVLGLFLALLNLFILRYDAELLIDYQNTDIYFLYRFPEWVLMVSMGINSIGAYFGAQLILGKIKWGMALLTSLGCVILSPVIHFILTI